MSLLKRIAVAVTAQVDRLVGEIENHDAVVEAGIRESRRLYAKASVRHARMKEEGERLRRRLGTLSADAAAWRERALAASEESKGLECLRRSRHAAAQAQSLAETWERHAEVEGRLGQELAAIRERLEHSEHRRQLMRSREATADAASRIRETEGGATLDLDETFERWEMRVCESELVTGALPEVDSFEREVLAGEECDSLKAELDALKRDRNA